LHLSDDIPGIYFFRSTSNKVWDEMPFEFDEAVKKEFPSLPELPVVRKKEKAEKYVFPSAPSKTDAKVKNVKVKTTKPAKTEEEEEPYQPNYKLKHKIAFTDLEKVIYRQPRLNKNEVLDYYDKISESLLPFLKDRPQWVKLQSDRKESRELSAEVLVEDSSQGADWIQSTIFSSNKTKKEILLCNDRDHLLYYVENGCLEFAPGSSRIKSVDSPDYIVIVLDGDESELNKTIEVALGAKTIFDGLHLPSFIKTDGRSGLHIYMPLDSKSDFETSKNAAESICRLIRMKIPSLAVFQGNDEDIYGKVVLDYSVNEKGKGIIAPYSLIAGDSPTVATPLNWNEVENGLRLEEFNSETILKRLKKSGDPFESLFRKKINADDLLTRLEENYSFLF
jgi:bifunctional non-homologous end joining protein LigD